jgi:hypothetical protein
MTGLGDFLAVWMDASGEDPSLLYLFLVLGALTLSVSFGLLMVYLSKQKAAIELAHYGSKRRPLNSFVCKVCLHRSYAVSHIKRRYCARCDKTYPEKAKIWRLDEARQGRIAANGN